MRTGRRDGVSHLFDCWPRLIRQIKSIGHLALFLDFDGTLTSLRRWPEDVPPLDSLTCGSLRELANRRGLDVYVISGRRLADLRPRVRVPGVRLFGLYGGEGRGVPFMREERELVQKAKWLLRTRLSKMKRIWLEDKKLGLAVHYRGAPLREVRATRLVVQGVVKHFQPRLRLLQQKKAWELLPYAVGGKESAVLRLLAKSRQATLAIFVGDDAADESAFAALRHGVTVRVGNTRRTRARFYLRNPREVLTFLQRLEAEMA
jgi:trehalose-phosphatase